MSVQHGASKYQEHGHVSGESKELGTQASKGTSMGPWWLKLLIWGSISCALARPLRPLGTQAFHGFEFYRVVRVRSKELGGLLRNSTCIST